MPGYVLAPGSAGAGEPYANLPPNTHAHVQGDVTGLSASLAAKQDTSAKGQANGYASLGADGKVPAAQLPASQGGGGAKAVYINLVNHFTTLENTTSANAAWKIPAAATYGQVAIYLDMAKLGTPASAEFVVCYTNTATTGTNLIGLRLGAAPVAAGTTVTQIASSQATLANSSTYPQTIVKALTVSELGSTAQWVQIALNLATSTVGPNIFHAALVLYF
jgi:hypothetical protein